MQSVSYNTRIPGKWEEGGRKDTILTVCGLFLTEISLDECSHSSWISRILVSDFFGLYLLF